MQSSYTTKYLKIYFWQGLAILVSFVSMFIIIPIISKTPSIYGIYSICISLNIFLSYADLGFLSAGFKYASESHALNDGAREIKITGFVGFLLMLFIIPLMLGIIFLSFNPGVLIKNLPGQNETVIASRLLLILGAFSPLIILQRIISIIFGIRIEDYLPRRISIVTSCLTIASVFYFFSGKNYDIVGYYLFSQIMVFVSVAASMVVARKRYRYDFFQLLKSFRFHREIFHHTKKLAFTTLFGTVCSILYYELDTILIARFLGADKVAIYAVCLTFINFLRSIYGTLYGPFTARFNHFIGLKDLKGLLSFFTKVIQLTIPAVFPVFALFLLMRPFILSWVGPAYALSVPVGSLLILIYSFAFIHYPGSILVQAQEKFKLMNLLAVANVVLYLGGLFLFVPGMGVNAFAMMKLATFLLSAGFYIVFTMRSLKIRVWDFLNKFFIPALVPLTAIFLIVFLALPYLSVEKNKLNLLTVVLTGAGASLAGASLYMVFSKTFRSYIAGLFRKFVRR